MSLQPYWLVVYGNLEKKTVEKKSLKLRYIRNNWLSVDKIHVTCKPDSYFIITNFLICYQILWERDKNIDSLCFELMFSQNIFQKQTGIYYMIKVFYLFKYVGNISLKSIGKIVIKGVYIWFS